MPLSEEAILHLEEQIPVLAELALRQAYWQVLASGDSVVIADDGKLIEVFPDGTRNVLKEIAKPQAVTRNQFILSKH